MPRYLRDIKLVDLAHSEWDKKASDPGKGEYVFTDKKYLKGNHSRNPDYFYSWCFYHPPDGLRAVRDWKTQYNYSYVTVADTVWPEGIAPDVNGNYLFGDLVLMKRPLLEELEDRKMNQELSRLAVQSRINEFQNLVERAPDVPPGAAKVIDSTDQLIKKLMG